jgi:origin recognition complex subunit 3
LEILNGYVKTHGTKKVIVAFQDSEAFDTVLLAELITLFRHFYSTLSPLSRLIICSSWLDRIPFVILFGIATSVDLFHERLSRNASRCLCGVQFDVEQTSLILERLFQKAIAGFKAPLRLGPVLVSNLIERQHDHIQSVQAFNAALKVRERITTNAPD